MNTFTIRAYDHDGVLLNVSGKRDEDGCEITRITAADSEIDLFDLFKPRTIRSIASAIDAQLCEEARADRKEVRTERHQWHAEFRVAA